jgi:hypothetical protein
MGNLSFEEARTFLFDHVLPSYPLAVPGAIEAWKHVYEVCGGNPGMLRNCAGEASAFGWDAGELCMAANEQSDH